MKAERGNKVMAAEEHGLQPIEELIANYGDATSTSWTDERYQIWRDHTTGAAISYIPSHGHAIIPGDPLCDPSQYSRIIPLFLHWLRRETKLKPIWILVSPGVEDILGEKLGWRSAPAAQNTAGKEHYCGHCHLGCGSGEKRGPAVSWLPAAGAAGAQFMEGFKVDKVLFAADGETATGIEGVWVSRGPDGALHSDSSERTTRRVVVKAKKVVISGGTLRSPLILMNSGVKVGF